MTGQSSKSMTVSASNESVPATTNSVRGVFSMIPFTSSCCHSFNPLFPPPTQTTTKVAAHFQRKAKRRLFVFCSFYSLHPFTSPGGIYGPWSANKYIHVGRDETQVRGSGQRAHDQICLITYCIYFFFFDTFVTFFIIL